MVSADRHSVCLADVVDLRLSSVDKKITPGEKAVRLCNYSDVYQNRVLHADMDYMAATATEREIRNCRLAVGDVIITKDSETPADIGVPALVREEVADLVCGYHLAILRPRKSALDGQYLHYALLADAAKRQFQMYANGITRFGLRAADIGRVAIPLPPLPEQRKIAAILSSVDDAIEKTRAVIDQVQVVKRGLMQELLTRGLPGRHTRFKQTEIGEIPRSWRVASLADCGAMVTSGSRGWAKYYSNTGTLFLRITNLARDTIRLQLDDIKHVALPAGSAESRRTRVHAGDLVISITADLGMVGVIPEGIGEAYVNQHLALVRLPEHELRPEFAAYFLTADISRRRFTRLNDSGAKAGLNLPTIMKLTVPQPPRDEQDAIVRILSATEDRLEVESRKLDGLRVAKSALTSVLLTGELRVTPDVDAA